MDDRARNRHADGRFVDDLLEALLGRTCEVEPRAGLEGRILARVRAEHQARQRFGWTWQLAAASAALVIAVAAVYITRRSILETQRAPALVANQSTAAMVELPAKAENPAAPSRPSRRRERRLSRPRETVQVAGYRPRPEVFPSPTPLSGEEKLLLDAKDAPPLVLLAWRGDTDAIEELKIKELDIPPLQGETASRADEQPR